MFLVVDVVLQRPIITVLIAELLFFSIHNLVAYMCSDLLIF